ncbi:MAG: metallophosphoesterase [Candidatus Marinimicrobia bacterium]|nr:metallophosphoesterase [Candidatus Neomarinimicrobiota bacterium]
MANLTVIHLSDLHIGLRSSESTRTRKTFTKIAESFPEIPIIITGDLTDSATKKQFGKARELLDELSSTNPILTVPGNHDYAWKGNILRDDGWENWVKYHGSPLGWGRDNVPWMGIDHEPEGVDGLGVWEDENCVYFGIDSGDPLDKQISARGFISKKLAYGLKESLENYAGKTRIAFLHHHPFTGGFFTKLMGSRMLLTALKDNCELLLFGHEHEYGIWWDNRGIPLIVSSHKSTDTISGDCLMITVINIENAGTPNASFHHRLELL